MIRRRLPDGFALIAQDDHARACGTLALAWGNLAFPRPQPFPDFLAGVVLHDCGWAAHDFSPPPSPDGLPPDVFDPPPADDPAPLLQHMERTHAIWEQSATAATAAGPWAALLVSVHVLTLSAYASAGASALPLRFACNRFQHRQIERQEALRTRLGMPLDRPLTSGLADLDAEDAGTPHPLDLQLIEHYRLLQTLDLMSLAVCCTTAPVNESPPLGRDETRITWRRFGDDLRVRPWPFREETVTLEIPGVVVPRRHYASADDLADAMAASPRTILTARLIA